MIVISRNLVLAEGDESSADNGVILWDNLVTASNIEATSEDASHPASNLANPATHLYWLGGVNTGDEYLTVTFNSPTDVDGVGIARHNLGSGNIALSVEVCEDIGESPQVWTEVLEDRVLADDAPFMGRFELQTVMALRVRLQPGDEAPQIGVLYAGAMLVLERSIKIDAPHTPFPMGIVSKEVNGKSESGNFLGRIEINRLNESTAGFEWFRPDWYRANFQPFIVARPPFFYAWNPTEYPTEVGYAWLISNPMPEVDPVTRRVAIELKMQGVV